MIISRNGSNSPHLGRSRLGTTTLDRELQPDHYCALRRAHSQKKGQNGWHHCAWKVPPPLSPSMCLTRLLLYHHSAAVTQTDMAGKERNPPKHRNQMLTESWAVDQHAGRKNAGQQRQHLCHHSRTTAPGTQ